MVAGSASARSVSTAHVPPDGRIAMQKESSVALVRHPEVAWSAIRRRSAHAVAPLTVAKRA
jgi:hypothetical protein